MKLNYCIEEKQYIETLAAILKNRRKSAVNILTFLIMTVVQFGFALYNVLSGKIEGSLAVIILGLSVMIMLAQCVYQLAVRQRAVSQYSREKKSGKISQDFFKEQRLELNDDLLTLKCGKTRLSYDGAYFQKAENLGPMLLLTFRRDTDIHQLMIPDSAFSSSEQKEAFIRMLHDSRTESIKTGFAEQNASRPADTECSVEFSRNIKQFTTDYIKCARYAYLTRVPWGLMSIAKLAGTAYLLYHTVSGDYKSLSFIIFAICVCLLLNYNYLVTYTPIIRGLAKKYVRSLFNGLDEMNFAVDVTETNLVFSGDSFYNEIPLANLYAAEKTAKNLFLYMKDGTGIAIPIEEQNSKDVSRCYLQLSPVADRNWRNRDRSFLRS